MKFISSLIVIAALSSCVAKPWMVGSVNDHYTMHSYEAGKPIELAPPDGTVHAAPAKQQELNLNPVGHTSSNPLQ